MTSAHVRHQLPEGFQRLGLTPTDFHTFYHTFVGLRFPLNVAEVLDLRYLINHSVDDFIEPPLTPDHRQFRESLEKALDSFGIENPRHRERMLKTFAMLRELHLAHVLASRNAEERLHLAMADNRIARRRAMRLGLGYIAAAAASVAGWFALPDHDWYGWLIKILSLLCAVQSWRCFRALPRLDEQAQVLRRQLNELLRERVNSLNWKMLIHKMALVLGFKQIDGIEVFRMESDHHDNPGSYH